MHPVRAVFWLVVASAVLTCGHGLASAWLLSRFNARFDALAPWTMPEAAVLEEVRRRLLAAMILGLGIGLLLLGAATAVPRRTPHTRAVVSWALLLVAVVLLLGIVFSPDSALLADSEPQLRRMQQLLPMWYSVLHSCTVATVIGASIVGVVRFGKDQAVDYYQRHDPTATWPGFTSWLDVARGKDLG